MKKLWLLPVIVCAGFTMIAAQESLKAADSTKILVQKSVKKQVSIPKPKTNWSKIKELFL